MMSFSLTEEFLSILTACIFSPSHHFFFLLHRPQYVWSMMIDDPHIPFDLVTSRLVTSKRDIRHLPMTKVIICRQIRISSANCNLGFFFHRQALIIRASSLFTNQFKST